MDLAEYINELLGLEGEVNVPEIGRFAHTRINGYYNEQENKFYPPAHKINFDPDAPADDTLATFISDKKNISLASAKYFIEKYVNGLKQQIPVQDVDIAGLGQLYLNGSTIGFRDDNPANETDPAFFGLKPVGIHELADKPAVKYASPPLKAGEEVKAPSVAEQVMTGLINDRIPPAPVKPADAEQPPVVEMPTVIERSEESTEEEYDYDEPVRRNNKAWIVVLLILIIALLALMGLYKYKPEWFNLPKEKPQTFTVADTTTGQSADTSKTDTTKKVATKKDSLTKAQALITNNTNAVDTAAVLHYEILGGAYNSSEQAYNIINRYQSLGLHPRLLKHTKGNSYKITLGTYFNKEQAQKVEDSIATGTNLKEGTNIYLQTYKPKQ